MQNHLQNHFKFEFEKDPYACLLLFTHLKMVKHENKVHIINPWIFLILLDILFIKFGVRNKKLFNFQFLLIFWNFLNSFISFNFFLFYCVSGGLTSGPPLSVALGLTPY